MNLIPIAKARTNQFRSRRPRGTFDDKVFAVEKIFGVLGITGNIRREPPNGAKTVSVISQPLPTSSATPHRLVPAGWDPTGAGDQEAKLKLP